MAVTFDARFHQKFSLKSSPASFTSNAGTTTGSVGANSNRVLIGFAHFNDTVANMGTVSMTWAGNAMTAIGSGANTGGGQSVFMFGLKTDASVTTGAQTLSCSWTGGTTPDTVVGAISFFNCDTTTGWQNAGSDTGSGTSASSAVTSANGNMAVVAHANNNASSTTISAGTAGYTETSLNGNYASGYQASTGASSTVTWTLGSSVGWANVKADVIAASGGATIGGPVFDGRTFRGLTAGRAIG